MLSLVVAVKTNSENVDSLHAHITDVFVSHGAKCVTIVTDNNNSNNNSSSSDDFLFSSDLSFVHFSLPPKASAFSTSLEACPFLTASLDDPESLLNWLSNQSVPQNVLLALYVNGGTDQLNSSHGYFKSNPNSVVVSPAKDGSIIWRPKVHPTFSLDEVAVWTSKGALLTVSNGESDTDAELDKVLFNPEGLRLHGDTLTASAVAYSPFYIPGEEEGEESGIEVELVRTIVNSMGGKVKIGPPTDGGIWGEDRDGDGIFSGMVGDLQVKRCSSRNYDKK